MELINFGYIIFYELPKKNENKKSQLHRSAPVAPPIMTGGRCCVQVPNFGSIFFCYIKDSATDKEIKEASVENTMDAEARSVSLFIWEDRI